MITRSQMEIVTATATALTGVVAMIGAQELGVGWADHGPEPGAFPFWVGVILLAASLWNGVSAILRARGTQDAELFMDKVQARRIGTFLGPIAAFVVLTVFLGTYVATTLYLVWVSWRQGGLKPWKAVLLGVVFSIALYLVFEIIFLVPLHKGPLEAALGIY